MAVVQLRHLSSCISSTKDGSKTKANSQLKNCINDFLCDHRKGHISEHDMLDFLTLLSKFGQDAEADKRAIENGNNIDMPAALAGEENASRSFVTGLFGSQIYNDVEDIVNTTESSQNYHVPQMEQIPHYKDAAGISKKIERDCASITLQLTQLAYYIQGCAFQDNGYHTDPQSGDKSFSCLANFFALLQDLQKLERRHRELAYASLGPSKDFRCLFESFASFFRCLEILRDLATDDQLSTKVTELFTEALQSSWILKDGPKLIITIATDKTKQLYKSAPSKAFDINLRFLGDQEGLQLKMIGDPVLSLESKDGVEVSCKMKYGNSEFKENSLRIEKISFENLRRLTGDGLALYQHFYVLKLKLQVSFLGNPIELKFKTFPFTVYETAHQIHESTGAVKWLIFSQEEMNGEVYELKRDLPRQDVLQMFDLMLKYNTDKGGRCLDEKERQELGRLIGRQNPGNSVTMGSIFTDDMKARKDMKQRFGKDCNFPLFTWFQGGLNTLALFYDFWMRGLILGFYSKKDASEMLKLSGCTKGDACVRISQHALHHPKGKTPLTDVTIHIALGDGKEFIGSFVVKEDSSFQTAVLEYVNESGDNKVPSIQQFLPKRIPLSEVCPEQVQHYAGTVETNRYFCRTRERPRTREPLSEEFKSMSLEDKTPPKRQAPHEDGTTHRDQMCHRDQSSVQGASCQNGFSDYEEPPFKKPSTEYFKVSKSQQDPFLTEAALPEELEDLPKDQLFFKSSHFS